MINKLKAKPYIFGNWILFFFLGFQAMREFLNTNIFAFVLTSDLMQSKRFIAYLATSVVLLLGWIGFIFLFDRPIVKSTRKITRAFPLITKLFISIFLIIVPGLTVWILPLPKDFTIQAWMAFFLFYCIALLIEFLFFGNSDSRWMRTITLAILVLAGGFGYAFFSRMNQVTGYPFTTYWSEGNRFFDYSTLLGSKRYIFPQGEKIQAFVNWGMALPWALPFLIPNISISFYRLWYQLVWIVPPMLLGYISIDKSGKQKNKIWTALAFALWSFLFIEQGPIYPPLVIGAIFTIIAVRQRLPLGMVIIAAISYYVRSARWTWGYAPGLWAGLLSLLLIQKPSLNKKNIKQLIKPIGLGLAGYFGGQLFPSIIRMINRGADLRLLPNPTASTSRQPLLWDRLWPNPTYPPGIILGIAWTMLPVILFIVYIAIKRIWKTNWMQNLAMSAIAIAFLVVGIIASTKIGGGSNLHNLDMFLITILIILAELFNENNKHWDSDRKYPWFCYVLLIALILSPVTYSLRKNDRLTLPPQEKTDEAMIAVRNKVEEYNDAGEILFIDHRQLLTFNLVQNVPLIDEYEKKYLMDWALTGNQDYFEPFYEHLAAQRFALIVNEPLNLINRGEDYSFGEENDAYVQWVTTPLYCQYEPIYTSQATALELLIPRTSPAPSYLDCEAYFNE